MTCKHPSTRIILSTWKIGPFTAVASMRRTETLASVKFYQILSIFIFFIRLIILEDFIRLISYNGPCVRLGCSFFLATALPLQLAILVALLGRKSRTRTTGADPGFFSGGGALVSCSTSTPINHIFFLQNTSCIRKPQVNSRGGGGGGCAPPAPSP